MSDTHGLKMIFPRWHAVSAYTEQLWVTLKWRSLLLKLPLTWYMLCGSVLSHSLMSDSLWSQRSPPGSSVHGDSQAKILEWVAMPSSRGSSQPREWTQVSRIAGRFFIIWDAREAQEYWRVWLIPSPGNLPNPGIEPWSPALQVDSLPAKLPGKPLTRYKVVQRLYYERE